MFLNRWLILPLLLCSCTAPAAIHPSAQNTQLLQQMGRVNSQGIVNSTFRYSADKTTLTVQIEREAGQVFEYSSTRRPLTGAQITTETVLTISGSTIYRHRTTVDEAELAIKVSANNGWQEIYADLKERYKLAGLSE